MARTSMVTAALAAALLLAACAQTVAPPDSTPSATATADTHPKTPPPSRAPAAQESSPPARNAPRHGFVAVDGDTIERGSLEVRVIGIDTPEIGKCGYAAARAVTQRFIAGGIRLSHRSGRDQYGRLLAYVVAADGRDLGTALIRRGLANARYDSTDGYDGHPHQARYRRLDRRVKHRCGRLADGLGGPEPYYRPRGAPFPNCDAATQVGAAPLRRGDPGWNPDLDGDGDGTACE